MNITPSMQMDIANTSLKQAANVAVLSKVMNQDASSVHMIKEMASQVAKSTGVGANLDISI